MVPRTLTVLPRLVRSVIRSRGEASARWSGTTSTVVVERDAGTSTLDELPPLEGLPPREMPLRSASACSRAPRVPVEKLHCLVSGVAPVAFASNVALAVYLVLGDKGRTGMAMPPGGR